MRTFGSPYRSPHAEVVPAEEVARAPAVVGAPAGLVAVVGAVRHPVAAEGQREATTVRAGELGGAAQGDCMHGKRHLKKKIRWSGERKV